MGIWLAALGGMLLGQTLMVIRVYWRATVQREHVLAISASYLILVTLSMQPALNLRISPRAHIILALMAYALGAYSLFRIVPVGPLKPVAAPELGDG